MCVEQLLAGRPATINAAPSLDSVARAYITVESVAKPLTADVTLWAHRLRLSLAMPVGLQRVELLVQRNAAPDGGIVVLVMIIVVLVVRSRTACVGHADCHPTACEGLQS
jgi:hypothetical protein